MNSFLHMDAKFGWKWLSGSWEDNCLNVVNVLIAIIFHWPFISTNLNFPLPNKEGDKNGFGEQKLLLIYAGNRGSFPVGTEGLTPLTYERKAYAKTTQRTTKVSGWASSFFIGYKNRQSCQKYAKGPVPLTDEHKEYAKGHQSFGVGFNSFHPL